MNPLSKYILDSEKKFEFKIKLALEVTNEVLDRIEHALNAFGLESLSKPKSLPITAKNLDFPSVDHAQIYLLQATLKYPCTDEQIRATLAAQGRLPLSCIVVYPKDHPEVERRDLDQENEGKDSKALLDTEDLGGDSAQDRVGQKRIDFLKDLQTRKYEFASNGGKE